MTTGGDGAEDMGAAVDALLRSESWERRLTEARESRRKVLEAKRAKKAEPLLLRSEWTAPPPVPAPALPFAAPAIATPAPRAGSRRLAILGAAALAAILAAIALWPRSTAEEPEIAPRRSVLQELLRPAPMNFARVPVLDLPSGYGVPPQVRLENLPPLRLSHARSGLPAIGYDLPAPAAVTTQIAVEGRLPLSLAPPATEAEAYAVLFGRLRLAAGPDALLRVHLPPGAPTVEGPEGAELRQSVFAMPDNVVRFYHPEDAEGASRAAEVAGARLADMTGYAPRPDRGVLELWITTLPTRG
ncbi:hypothetical protein QCN27_10030 [Cereibacter sp. SYSU M97828]|nr:hypothetical protein [Cereibacter flavus]